MRENEKSCGAGARPGGARHVESARAMNLQRIKQFGKQKSVNFSASFLRSRSHSSNQRNAWLSPSETNGSELSVSELAVSASFYRKLRRIATGIILKHASRGPVRSASSFRAFFRFLARHVAPQCLFMVLIYRHYDLDFPPNQYGFAAKSISIGRQIVTVHAWRLRRSRTASLRFSRGRNYHPLPWQGVTYGSRLPLP